MKATVSRSVLVLAVCWMAFGSLSQAQDCQRPMLQYAFEREVQRVRAAAPDRQRQRDLWKGLLRENCLASSQAVVLGRALVDDYERYAFYLDAYGRLVDPSEYYLMYDGFRRMSMAFRFYDAIREREGYHPYEPTEPPAEEGPESPEAPRTPEPGCEVPEADMDRIVQRVEGESFDSDRLSAARAAIKSRGQGCFKTAQIRRVGELFSFPQDQLEFLKFAYDYVSDTENYFSLADLFSFSSDREKFDRFVESKH